MLVPQPAAQVPSEEAVQEARLRSLFPDYKGGYDGAVDDPSREQDDSGTGDKVGKEEVARALGHLSEAQLESMVARHARLFSAVVRRRQWTLRRMMSSRPSKSRVSSSVAIGGASDGQRMLAHADAYRASVLLGGVTRSQDSYELPPVRSTTDQVSRGKGGVELEAEFASSHMLALANAAMLCSSGRGLLERCAVSSGAGSGAVAGKDAVQLGVGSSTRDAGDERHCAWGVDEATTRSLMLVDPFVDFQHDANVEETRLAYAPLSRVMQRVASLLDEFPGHAVLIEVRLGFGSP